VVPPPWSTKGSQNRPTADIVGSRNLALRLLARVDALDRLVLLMVGELRLASHPHPPRLRAFAAFARAGAEVDTRDIAEAAALSLLKMEIAAEPLPRETIELVGPDALTGEAIASIRGAGSANPLMGAMIWQRSRSF
jgi:hypothetical protein